MTRYEHNNIKVIFLTSNIPWDNTPLGSLAVLNSHPWMALLSKAVFISKPFPSVPVPSKFEYE